MSELLWCDECRSRHTKEFGDEFHGRLLAPLQPLFVVGDRVTEEWVEGGTHLTTISPDGSRRTEFVPDEP